MRKLVRFVLVLVLGLAALAWLAHGALTTKTRSWFETDVALRARVVVTSARASLAASWDEPVRLESLLGEIARDERIMAAAACSDDGTLAASTKDYPLAFSCWSVREKIASEGTDGSWTTVTSLPGGPVEVSATPVTDDSGTLGFVVLVHDISFVERREAAMRGMLLAAFGILAAAAALLTLVAAQLSWRGWTSGLQRALRGEERLPQFRPLLRDVKDLVAQLGADRDVDRRGLRWDGARLKEVLTRLLHGERILIVANREPYIHEREGEGVRVVHPASGLVTALEPVMRACSGAWIAHGSGSADRETADRSGRVKVPPGEESYIVRRVWLSEEEDAGYYYGFSNEGLWPLCHVAHTRPIFRSTDWAHYREVNQRFADAVCDEADGDDPIVLVQDYHFALAPRMIRDRLPRATILTFWHIPWPNAERFGICPWRDEIIDGLLGSSIVGFQTQQHCNQFIDTVDAFVESRIDREEDAIERGALRTLVRPYPISIEWPVRWLESLPSVEDCREQTFEQLGLAPDALLGVGIDRLDYTKGIEERLLAVERLLERSPHLRGRFTFVQLAAPSRTRIDRYRELTDRVEATAEALNRRFGSERYRPVILLRAHHEPPTVYRFYRAADVCYVSSLHDGMNLVAKEFVAARTDERGVLVLSRFTGAARELTEALIVNPYDLEEASIALAAALAMHPSEQRERMRAMRSLVSDWNVYRWAGRMLVDAAQIRRKERLVGRITRGQAASRNPR